MHQLLVLVLLVAIGYFVYRLFNPTETKVNIIDDLLTMKTHTVNLLNKVLKSDTTSLVDFHIPDVHCDGLIDRILSPEELAQLSQDNKPLFDKLVDCGYTRTVGLLHGFALWASTSTTKDGKSFQYFMDCVNHITWKDPTLFKEFHSSESKIAKCII